MAALGGSAVVVTEGHVGFHGTVLGPAHATRRRGEGNAACRARPGAALASGAGTALTAALAEGLHWAHLHHRLSRGTHQKHAGAGNDIRTLHMGVSRDLSA